MLLNIKKVNLDSSKSAIKLLEYNLDLINNLRILIHTMFAPTVNAKQPFPANHNNPAQQLQIVID